MGNSCAIIGVGAISAAGLNAFDGYTNILSGKSFLSPLSLFEWHSDELPLVGEVRDFDDSLNDSRTEALAIEAINEAISSVDLSDLRVGLTVATTLGGSDRADKKYFTGVEGATGTRNDFVRYEVGALAMALAKKYDVDGFHTVTTGCSAGVHAIGMAKRLLEIDQYDAVISVGADALGKVSMYGFDSMLLLNPEGSRPFDREGSGRSLGESAGAVLMMSDSVVEKQNLQALSSITGWGASTDAYDMISIDPDGAGLKSAVLEAMEDAGIKGEQIDWILAHGTGNFENDIAEITVYKSVFNENMPPFTSIKGSIGHTLAASGVLEIVYAVQAINREEIPDTYGFKTIDPEIGLAPSQKKKMPIKHVLKTTFGFGGNNGVLILSGGKI